MKWHGWKVDVRECEIIPTGYGAAWRDWSRPVWVCLPLPFNVIAGRLRALYFWLVSGCWQTNLDRRIAAALEVERSSWRRSEIYKDDARRRRDFRAGYEYMHGVMLSEINDKPKPELPEWAK